jgi:hypothetical protein
MLRTALRRKSWKSRSGRPARRLVTHGQDYIDRGAAYFEKKRAEREIVGLKRKAAEPGLKLVPAT